MLRTLALVFVALCAVAALSGCGASPPAPAGPDAGKPGKDASASCSGQRCGTACCTLDQACNPGGEGCCTPDCNRKSCGDDGCGGSCGKCGTGTKCDLGQCVACTAQCTGRKCGSDGCNGTCGACLPTQTCTSGGQCCTPSCTGRQCGDDGCGGSCGPCLDGTCNASGKCIAGPGPDAGPRPDVGTPDTGTLPMPPKVMLVLDKSGSMKTHPEDDLWGCCTTGNGTSSQTSPCTGYDATGNCKWTAEIHVLTDTGGFLDGAKTTLRFGLAVFPDATTIDSCVAGKVLVETPPAPGEPNRDDIKAALTESALLPGGGTPTADMLLTLAVDSGFMSKEARRYVILVTDGVPNCNANLNGATCTCTTSSCTDSRMCLDDQRTIDAVKALKAADVITFIIGFGAATASDPNAISVLNQAAEAGGAPQTGATKYYQAGSQTELRDALDLIQKQLLP